MEAVSGTGVRVCTRRAAPCQDVPDMFMRLLMQVPVEKLLSKEYAAERHKLAAADHVRIGAPPLTRATAACDPRCCQPCLMPLQSIMIADHMLWCLSALQYGPAGVTHRGGVHGKAGRGGAGLRRRHGMHADCFIDTSRSSPTLCCICDCSFVRAAVCSRFQFAL